MDNGFTRLANRFDGRAKEIASANKDVAIEIGEITDNYGLKVTRFADEIPKGEYDVSRHLIIDDITGTVRTSSAGSPSHTHTVEIKRPDGLGKLQSGDRVVVVWDGNQAIVINTIVSGNNL